MSDGSMYGIRPHLPVTEEEAKERAKLFEEAYPAFMDYARSRDLAEWIDDTYCEPDPE